MLLEINVNMKFKYYYTLLYHHFSHFLHIPYAHSYHIRNVHSPRFLHSHLLHFFLRTKEFKFMNFMRRLQLM